MPEKITDPQRARRLARAIVSDILLYNPEKIEEGIKNDSLFESLEDELEEGRELYKSRVAPEITDHHNFFDLAVVDVLFKYTGKYESHIW
ncbi:MAG: hypothetical protein R6V10_12285 [bacterium]